jgi:hypothetical protein
MPIPSVEAVIDIDGALLFLRRKNIPAKGECGVSLRQNPEGRVLGRSAEAGGKGRNRLGSNRVQFAKRVL